MSITSADSSSMRVRRSAPKAALHKFGKFMRFSKHG
jgi:hypothetical protein